MEFELRVRARNEMVAEELADELREASDDDGLPVGVRLDEGNSSGLMSAEALKTIEFLLTVPGGIVNVGVIAAWLCRKFKGRAAKLEIDDVEVDIEEGQIKRVLQRKITMTREE